MSTVLVVTPIVIANWPVITAAVSAGVSALGYSMARQEMDQAHKADLSNTRTEIDIENSEILEGAAGTDEEIVVERDGVRAVFTRDARGALRVCMEGRGRSKDELRQLGEELIGRVTQQYAYHRIVTELKERKMTVVDERVTENQSVRIRVRNW